MEIQNKTSTFQYVKVRPAPPQFRPYAELSSEEKDAWVAYCTNWTWRAVECLVDLPDFQPSMKSVSKRLNISLEEAVDAVEGLESLKLIKRTLTGSFVRTARTVVPTDFGVPLNDVLRGHMHVATELSARIIDKENMRFSNCFFTSNRERLAVALKQIESIMRGLCEDIDPDSDTEVFALEFSCASLSARPQDSMGAQS